MSKLTNEFSWSKSRYDIFNECRRKYYYHYYASWGGWEPDVPAQTREIYILKQLKNRWMWAGDVVHKCLQKVLDNLSKGISPLPLEDILDLTRKSMRTDFRLSREGHYRQDPKSCALFEHEYQTQVTQEQWQQIAETAEYALSNFFLSPTFLSIFYWPKQDILEIENLASFEIEANKIYVKLDFCCRKGAQIYIYDWKTGKNGPDVDFQMACYALYVQKRWGIELNNCKIIEYNLVDDRLNILLLVPKICQEIEEQILQSIGQMTGLLKDKQQNIACEADFPQNEHLGDCKWCNYLKVCRPEEDKC